MSRFLDRQLWIVRYDDPNIYMNAQCLIEPGPDYKIGPKDSKSSPILLHYTPSPGHYEILMHKNREKNFLEEEVVKLVTTVQNMSDEERSKFTVKPFDICKILFLMEQETEVLREMYQSTMKLMDPYEVRNLIKDELKQRISKMFEFVENFLNTLALLSPSYFIDYYQQTSLDQFEKVLDPVISSLLGDELQFRHDGRVETATGPLSSICDRLTRYKPLY